MDNVVIKPDGAEIIAQMSFLYELSLSIGRSLDLEENCENFLRILMARKNYSYGAIWIKDMYLSQAGGSNKAVLVYGKPSYYVCEQEIPLSHSLFTQIAARGYLSINSQDPGFNQLVNEHHIKDGSYLTAPTVGDIEDI
jgi:hypothetical protein